MRLTVKIIPNAKKDEIVSTQNDDALKIRIAAPAVDGKANAALTNFLAKHYDIPKSHITIVRGEKSRIKVIDIRAREN